MDTSAYFAAANRRDANHAMARATMEQLILQKHRLMTTNFIFAEMHGLMLARGPRNVALDTIIRLKESPNTQIVRVEAQDEDRAWTIVVQYNDKDFSLIDATSVAVMERLGIRTAFALDRHFAQFG